MEVALVIAAAVLNFILGAIWRGLFGKQWALDCKPEESRNDPKPYLVSFIGSLWASYGISVLIRHIEPRSYDELIAIGVGTWLFVLVGLGAKHYAFGRVRLKAFFIDYGLDLAGLIVMCLVIGDI